MDTQAVLKEVEKKAETKTKTMVQDKTIQGNKVAAALHEMISEGANDFKQKTGRPMTYSEMRAAFG